MSKVKSIVAKPYHWSCGDGCCDDYGYDVTIEDSDGQHTYRVGDVVYALAEYLGVNIEWGDYDDE